MKYAPANGHVMKSEKTALAGGLVRVSIRLLAYMRASCGGLQAQTALS